MIAWIALVVSLVSLAVVLFAAGVVVWLLAKVTAKMENLSELRNDLENLMLEQLMTLRSEIEQYVSRRLTLRR